MEPTEEFMEEFMLECVEECTDKFMLEEKECMEDVREETEELDG